MGTNGRLFHGSAFRAEDSELNCPMVWGLLRDYDVQDMKVHRIVIIKSCWQVFFLCNVIPTHQNNGPLLGNPYSGIQEEGALGAVPTSFLL